MRFPSNPSLHDTRVVEATQRTSREKQTVMSLPPKFLPSMPRMASSASRRSPDAYSTNANPRGRLRTRCTPIVTEMQ